MSRRAKRFRLVMALYYTRATVTKGVGVGGLLYGHVVLGGLDEKSGGRRDALGQLHKHTSMAVRAAAAEATKAVNKAIILAPAS